MSDSQAYEKLTVSSDGVTVTKRFEEDEFPVPAIAFEFSSERDEDLFVQLTDTVPDSVTVEDLGFHPEYGSEYWTIDEDVITFEREIEANGEYTTVYGIRATGTEDVEKFLTRPTIEDVDPPLPESEQSDEEIIPEADDDVVKDVISGESTDVPGLEEETDEEIETLNLKDPNAPDAEESDEGSASADAASDGSSESADESGDGGAEQQSVDTDVGASNLVSALANEIRQNNVSADDVKLLRRAFEIAGQEGGSMQARVQRIQQDVADLRAYTDAMEEFLDENGTAQELLRDFDSDIEAFDDRLEDLQSELAANNEELDAVSETVSNVDGRIESVETEVGDVSEEVSEVEETVEGLDSEIDSLENEIESAVDSLEDQIEAVESKVTEADVAEQLEDLEAEISDLKTWQDQIKETFGG